MANQRIHELVDTMLHSNEEACRLIESYTPTDIPAEVRRKIYALWNDGAAACQQAFEILGPERSLNICLGMLEDFLPKFQELNPTNRSYAKALVHVRKCLPAIGCGNEDGFACRSLREYKTPGSSLFSFAILLFMGAMQDACDPERKRFSENARATVGPSVSWLWLCTNADAGGCTDYVIAAWEEVALAETLEATASLDRHNVMFSRPAGRARLEKRRLLTDMLLRAAIRS